MKATRISLIAVLAAATVLAHSPALRAQDAKDSKDTKDAPKREARPAPGPRGGFNMGTMVEQLKLTDDQQKKVEAVIKEQRDKMQALRTAPPEERREKGRALRGDMDKKMKDILDAEQYAKWEKMRPQGRGPGGPGGAPGERPTSGEKKADGEKK